MLFRSFSIGLVLGATVAAIALAGCGGRGPGKSFTLKIDYSGDVAYIVVATPASTRAVERVMLEGVRHAGVAAFVTTNKPTGALDCSDHATIGQNGPTPLVLHPYVGDDVSAQVYGGGSLADGICSGLQSTLGG